MWRRYSSPRWYSTPETPGSARAWMSNLTSSTMIHRMGARRLSLSTRAITLSIKCRREGGRQPSGRRRFLKRTARYLNLDRRKRRCWRLAVMARWICRALCTKWIRATTTCRMSQAGLGKEPATVPFGTSRGAEGSPVGAGEASGGRRLTKAAPVVWLPGSSFKAKPSTSRSLAERSTILIVKGSHLTFFARPQSNSLCARLGVVGARGSPCRSRTNTRVPGYLNLGFFSHIGR